MKSELSCSPLAKQRGSWEHALSGEHVMTSVGKNFDFPKFLESLIIGMEGVTFYQLIFFLDESAMEALASATSTTSRWEKHEQSHSTFCKK